MKYDIISIILKLNGLRLESFFEMKYDIMSNAIPCCLIALESFFEMKYDIINYIFYPYFS